MTVKNLIKKLRALKNQDATIIVQRLHRSRIHPKVNKIIKEQGSIHYEPADFLWEHNGRRYSVPVKDKVDGRKYDVELVSVSEGKEKFILIR